MVNGFRLVEYAHERQVYQKWNPDKLIRTTVTFTGTGDTKSMHVKHDQPRWVLDQILDFNVKRQNEHVSYGDLGHMQASIPLVLHSQIMKMCGHQPGHGYDQKKFAQIINDSDYSKLKTVPGKI